MPVNTSFDLQALSNSGYFRQRVKNALGKVAGSTLDGVNVGSPPAAPSATSKAYARTVLGNLDVATNALAGWLVTRPNVISTTITATLTKGQVVVESDAIDAALESQINTDWPLIAGG